MTSALKCDGSVGLEKSSRVMYAHWNSPKKICWLVLSVLHWRTQKSVTKLGLNTRVEGNLVPLDYNWLEVFFEIIVETFYSFKCH